MVEQVEVSGGENYGGDEAPAQLDLITDGYGDKVLSGSCTDQKGKPIRYEKPFYLHGDWLYDACVLEDGSNLCLPKRKQHYGEWPTVAGHSPLYQ